MCASFATARCAPAEPGCAVRLENLCIDTRHRRDYGEIAFGILFQEAPMADMSGQVALVTGGGRGIGLAISERLANRGVTVAVGYSRGKDSAQRFLDDHPGASAHQGNVGSNEDCERVISEVIDQHGHLDVLVNNAGITIDKTVRKMTPQDWDHVVNVNLSGAFYLSRAVLQQMLDRGYGRIVNISSVIGSSGNIGQANYAAAKSGLFGLTMSLALETARKGITVNSVTPGFVSTDMTAALSSEILEKVAASIPVGRLGEPDEIARMVEFLADPDSGYITGQVFGVNGGLYM
jgi:acetoacetyl-CoA reductase